ncbi:RNA polymerase II subunit A C-terminal domain phosphatase, partial [Cryomyces antarcticus]
MADPRLARQRQPPPPPPPPAEPVPDSTKMGLDGANDNSSTTAQDGGFNLKFCTVCASNQN